MKTFLIALLSFAGATLAAHPPSSYSSNTTPSIGMPALRQEEVESVDTERDRRTNSSGRAMGRGSEKVKAKHSINTLRSNHRKRR